MVADVASSLFLVVVTRQGSWNAAVVYEVEPLGKIGSQYGPLYTHYIFLFDATGNCGCESHWLSALGVTALAQNVCR